MRFIDVGAQDEGGGGLIDATTVAQALGLLLCIWIFLRAPYRAKFKSHLTWRPHWPQLREQLKLGFPTAWLPPVVAPFCRKVAHVLAAPVGPTPL